MEVRISRILAPVAEHQTQPRPFKACLEAKNLCLVEWVWVHEDDLGGKEAKEVHTTATRVLSHSQRRASAHLFAGGPAGGLPEAQTTRNKQDGCSPVI